MNLLVTGLSLLCLANPLHSDLRASHWPIYEPYNPVLPVPHQLHGIRELRYISPTVQDRPTIIGHFPSPLTSSSYLGRAPETVSSSYHDFGSSDSSDHARRSKLEEAKLETGEIEAASKEEEIARKMRILDKLLSEDSTEKDPEINGIEDKIITEESKRVVREVRNHKPGFFWTLAKITFEVRCLRRLD